MLCFLDGSECVRRMELGVLVFIDLTIGVV